ncbi:MAG: RHS repeat-associated core domain-containing protein [Pseudomonadales bacterium]|jgi:RHS repeat-associated protein
MNIKKTLIGLAMNGAALTLLAIPVVASDYTAYMTAYNDQGLVSETSTLERDNASASSTYHSRRGYEYNSMGKVIRELLYEDPSLNSQPTITLEYDYDGRGNLVAKRQGGSEWTYEYDAKNRLVTETEPNGETIRYTYGAFDQVETLTRGNLVTTYHYNGFGELVSEESPVRGTTTYAYNAEGQITTITRADGRSESLSYQSGTGRLWKHTISGANTSPIEYRRSYNSDGLLSQVDQYIAAALTTRKSYTYDDFGRVTRERVVIGSTTRDLSSTYSATTGQLTRLTYPSGRKIEYTYNNGVYEWASKVEVVSTSGYRRIAAADVNYNPQGQIEGYSNMHGGGSQRRIYNGYGMLSSQSVLNSSGNATLNLGYSYSAGNPVRLVMATDYLNTTDSRWYHYDINSRLSTVTGGNPMYPVVKDSIGYFANGNIRSRTEISGTFSYNSYGQLQSAGNKNFDYNSIGNVTSTRFPNGVTGTLEYDARGLTNRYTWSGNDVRLTRDESNQLVKLTNGSQADYFTFVGANLLSQWDSSANKHFDYIYLNGQLLARHDSKIRHIAVGHIGQPVAMFYSGSGIGLNWRGVHNGYDIEETTTTESLHVKFPGQYDIIGNGLYYNYHRDYDPSIGRYLQSDPIGNAGGVNTYAYTSGNPVMMVDPLGLAEWCGDLKMMNWGYYGLAAGAWEAQVFSPMGNGNYKRATLQGISLGFGLGSPSSSMSLLKMSDSHDGPYEYALEGTASFIGATAVSGGGSTWGFGQIGDAFIQPSQSPAVGTNELSAQLVGGTSSLVDSQIVPESDVPSYCQCES